MTRTQARSSWKEALASTAASVVLYFGVGAYQALASAAAPPAKAEVLADFDMARVIRDAANRKSGSMKIGVAQAVRQVDGMLLADYGARGRIAGEPNARLKSLYTQAAHLLMNGHAISGGTLIIIAQQEAAYSRSAVGPAYSAFVNGMLAPVNESGDVLDEFAVRADAARALLADLRPELQMAAQLRVMGAIYGDAVAVDAGTTALRVQNATATEMARIAKALQAAGAR